MTEFVPTKQHFSFELYSPTSCTESGVPIVDRVSIQMQGDDLPLEDVVGKFELFLQACGYSMKDRYLDIVDRLSDR
jgi:hypothetical protein